MYFFLCKNKIKGIWVLFQTYIYSGETVDLSLHCFVKRISIHEITNVIKNVRKRVDFTTF